MFNTAFISVLKKRLLLSLAVLYLLVPLHQSLLEGFHKLSHALTHTSASHDHELDHELNRDHSHEHKAIAFYPYKTCILISFRKLQHFTFRSNPSTSN